MAGAGDMAGAGAKFLCCVLAAAAGGKDARGAGTGSLPWAGLEHPGSTSIHP